MENQNLIEYHETNSLLFLHSQVCAHLYKTLEEISAGSECIKSDSELPCSPDINIWAIGLCYILHKNLDFQEALYPCKGKNKCVHFTFENNLRSRIE